MKKTNKTKEMEEGVELTQATDVNEVSEQVDDKGGSSEENVVPEDGTAPDEEDETTVIDKRVDSILAANPQYKKLYINKKGFAYPEDAPEYQRKDAVLYTNKYYKKQKQ